MRYGLIIFAIVIASTGCAYEAQKVIIHPNCPEIPATTFKSAGLDAKAGSLKFGELVTIGEVSLKSDPKILSGISQSVRDDQVTDALICAAKERGELKTEEQVAHAWKVARFHRVNPTASEALEFHRQNPFPATPRSASEMDLKESRAISDAITGGDSFCYLTFVFASDAPTKPHWAINLIGKYALQNIDISIRERERFEAEFPNLPKERANARVPTSAEVDKFEALTFHIEVPMLGPAERVRMLRRWELPDRDQVTYQLAITTPYQQFHQHLKLRRVNGEWIAAYRVHKKGPRNEMIILRESIPDAFPKDESGKVNWLYH